MNRPIPRHFDLIDAEILIEKIFRDFDKDKNHRFTK
jgi:hypothetical protein